MSIHDQATFRRLDFDPWRGIARLAAFDNGESLTLGYEIAQEGIDGKSAP